MPGDEHLTAGDLAGLDVAPFQVCGDPFEALRIEAGGGRALAVGCDIGEADDLEMLVTTAVDTFGRIDVLINNAMAQTRTTFADSTGGDGDTAMRAKLRSLDGARRAGVPTTEGPGGRRPPSARPSRTSPTHTTDTTPT